MKKIVFVFLLIASFSQLKAQTTTATGIVKDGQGNPLHYVFVADNQAKDAVFTDSLGNFTINADAGSKLQFEYAGYADTAINVSPNAGLEVVIRRLGTGTIDNGTLSAQKTVSSESSKVHTLGSDMTTLQSGGAMSGAGLAHQKGDVEGSRYLFDGFVHGFVVNASGELVYNTAYLFDYDKIGGSLLITQDKVSVTAADKAAIKSFTLYSNTDQRFTFESVPAIDPKHYVQVLAEGKKYGLYKTISTKFVKSDYINSGITTHGNDFDQFVDEYEYYFMDVTTKQVQKISLKKKSLKNAFAKEADKVSKYLSDNSEDIDDAYAGKLGDYMNK